MTGAEQIQAERNRQMLDEHFDAAHDDEHARGELILASIGYAMEAIPQFIPIEVRVGVVTRVEDDDTPPDWWPWEESWWKPSTDPVVNLVKAGALIAAEIDRIQRTRR